MKGDSVRTVLLLLVTGCNFGASSKVDGMDSASEFEGETEGAADDGDDETDEDEDEEPDPLDVDNDDDGYTENQDDCDDQDDEIYPGAEDVCDEISNDCDDEIDEDALDDFEPNDEVRAPMGIAGSDDLVAGGFLHSDDDVDLFEFTINDGWIDLRLGVRVRLSNFTSEIAYKVTVTELSTGEKQEDFKQDGDDEIVIELNDSIFSDESGNYGVRVTTLEGSGCSHPYTLTISENTIVR
jgi:hypothetical protein